MQNRLTAGVGLKPQHYDLALEAPAGSGWFEVHAENYMVDGGPRLAWLDAIGARHPLSLHGVGLSLASAETPDAGHLARLAALVDRFQPALVSEHLAWCALDGAYVPDLLPCPRSREALDHIVANVTSVQRALGCRIAVENPSHYIRLAGHAFGEIEFLTEIASRSGCGLLLDLNNVWVGAANLNYSAQAYVDAFPATLVTEVHLAGHSVDPHHGTALLIDSHDSPVDEVVWALFRRFIARVGALPTLIERDGHVPDFETLVAERDIAHAFLSADLHAAA